MTATHPARRPDTEAWFDQLGVSWEFTTDLVLSKVDQAASLAQQVRSVPLHPEVVERYASEMARGARFPAIIVAGDIDKGDVVVLGGMHRYAAARAANQSTHPAYIVTGTEAQLLRVRVEDNARHGMPTSTAERVQHAVALMETGMTQREAAQVLGIPQPKLSIAAAVVEVDRRARALDANAAYFLLPQAARYELSQLEHDDVLAAAIDFTVATSCPTTTLRQICKAARVAPPDEALRLIGSELEDHHERATSLAGNVRRSSRTARARLESALTEIAALDPADVYDSCPNDDVRQVVAQRVMNAAAVLAPTHDLLTGKTRR